jgi:hypothetical protein
METAATPTQEKPDADTARMSVDQSGGHEARAPKMSRYLKVQLFLAHRDVVLLEEARLKLVKQGQDVSRNRLIAEAIRRYVADGAQPKTVVRG